MIFTAVPSLEAQPTPDGHSIQRSIVDITGPLSYTTGGEVLDPADLGFTTIFAVEGSIYLGGVCHTVIYDNLTGTLVFTTNGTEVAGAVNLTTVIVRTLIWGR